MIWDLEDPWTTQKERSSRNEASQAMKLPDKPKDSCRRLSKMSWSTVSNAALTSKRARRVGRDSPINVREEAQEEGFGGVAFPEARLAHRKQFIYLEVSKQLAEKQQPFQ